MSSNPKASDFPLDVEGVGHFIFATRDMRTEMRIAAEYSRLTEGVDTPTTFLAQMATWMSVLKVLTVEGPAGWNVDALDPLDQDTYDKIIKVYAALRAKEQSFRGGAPAAGKG